MSERNKARLISGTASQVINQLSGLAKAYGTEEMMINLMMPGESARLAAIDALMHWRMRRFLWILKGH
ncbi:hypothetical protein [Pseudomonas kitaguniensis]|uniref:hypothetical protein n=1 Tax=Pseudomonas kitaguniensis TaxID=2607908 RepID=UPI003D014838